MTLGRVLLLLELDHRWQLAAGQSCSAGKESWEVVFAILNFSTPQC
jgi:hypothetical protein